MEREGEKVEEADGEKQEILRVKLKRGILVGRKGSTSTPSTTWRFGVFGTDGSLLQEFNNTLISARKLGANLWEIQPQLKVIKKMNKQLGERPNKLKHVGLLNQLAEPRDTFWEKMAPYRHSISPSSCLKFGDSNPSLKTSTELVKVLNRIWSIEEQHASTKSLVKALKRELDHAQTRIEALLQHKKRDQDELAEDRFVRDNKEVHRIKDVLQAIKDDLEDERKLRKHSESLHRRLGRELSAFHSSFSNALKELERERSARILLEKLCDEFAKGIKVYEHKLRFLRQKNKNDPVVLSHDDGLILHVSEAWLDERMQMKQEELHSDPAENKTAVEKLSCEIETLLQAKSNGRCCTDDLSISKEPSRSKSCGQSLESFHLKEAASAPRRNEEDSIISDLYRAELLRGSSVKKTNKWSKKHGKHAQKGNLQQTLKPDLGKRVHSKKADSSDLQDQLEECISASVSCKGYRTQHVNGKSAEKRSPRKLKMSELMREDLEERRKQEVDRQKNVEAKLLRTNSLPAEGKQIQHDNAEVEYAFDPSKFTGPASPVEKWTSAVTVAIPEISESSSKRSQRVKENTLRAKLVEARLESQRVRSIASKGVS